MAEASSITDPSSSRTSDVSLLRSTSTKQENSFTFEGGDVTITVTFNGEEMKGKVISASMASASPVWKKFLFPPWAKEGHGPVKELDFKEDDGKALLFLLRIVHFQFAKIPVAFRASIKPLYNIAILCEQYDCVSITKTWSKDWCSRLRDVRLPLLAGDTRRKAYIAWAFGLPETFRGLAKMVEKCRVQANGTLEDDEAILPDRLLESIKTIREHALQKLLDIPYNHLEQCTSGGSACGDKRCTALVYGSLLLEVDRCGLWPKKTAAEIKDSISTIADLILNLKILYPKLELQTTGDLHTMITKETSTSTVRYSTGVKCRQSWPLCRTRLLNAISATCSLGAGLLRLKN